VTLACARQDETLHSAHERAALADDRGAGKRSCHGPNATMTALTREQVLALIRSHLVDELDVEADAVGEGTRFKQDLEADSLDLYTLVQELEDTYAVRMSEEQAAQILTVGQAVDFVLAHSSSNVNGTVDAGR
jgi:acyl carrier protein